MADLTQTIVAHGLRTQYCDLSIEAKRAIRVYLLDTLGVGIAGARAPLRAAVAKIAAPYETTGPNQAWSWGHGSQAYAPAYAAFVNGFQIHCQEYDCVHEPAVVHPMATILAALMADAQAADRAISGQEFAVALAVSVDLAAGIGVAVTSPIKFFRPANAGLFGAVLGVSRLRGFNAEQTMNALGYGLAFCSGTMQAHLEGKPALPVQIANAARSAITACDLAGVGMEGPHHSLDGPFGYFALFEDQFDVTRLSDSLGETWRIAEVSHKPFPTGRACQGGIVLMQKLREQGVAPSDVDEIVLTAPPLIERLVGRPLIKTLTANYARLCFQYCGAVALMSGTVGLDDFSEEALGRKDIHDLGRLIRVRSDGSENPAAFVPQTALATLKDGRRVTAGITVLYGSPAAPIDEAAHFEKFRACVDFGFDRPASMIADQLISLTENLETLIDIKKLAQLAAGQEV